MPLVLSTAQPQDAPRIADIHMAAFATNAMLLAQFPTPAVREGLRRTVAAKALADIQDAKTTVLIVRDLDQGRYGPEQQFDTSLDTALLPPAGVKVIAFAKWAHPTTADDHEYSEPEWVWPEGTNRGVLDRWTRKTEEAQANAVGSRPCYRLHFIGTDPSYQGQGAGSLLLNWGIRRCDEEKVPAYVESTIDASPFYKKHGFSVVETFSCALEPGPEEANGDTYQETSFLYEPLKSD